MTKILVIEDEKVLAEMYREKFVKSGFKVSLAMDSRKGLEMAKKEKPDLILLDILLPREDGIVFLKRLRNEAEISSIPIIAFSNYDDPKTKKEVINFGAKEYIIKANYTPEELIQKIKEYLKEKK